MSRITIYFEIGFYNGNVVTPVNIYMTIQPDEEYISNNIPDKRFFTEHKYIIVETRCLTRSALMEEEYEKKLN